jgi:hypothetical protein
MGVPPSEVSYTSVTAGRRDHEVHKGYVVAIGKEILRSAHKIMYICVLQVFQKNHYLLSSVK